MPALDRDLIAAIATAPGQGGIGIVRLSGPDARRVASEICTAELKARVAQFTRFFAATEGESVDELVEGAQLIDEGLVLYFPAPRSFTGEEVVELQGHGGPMVMRRLLDAVCAKGARIARPGEFSERAFHNGKLDLVQAEAVADLIASTSEAAASAAINSLTGKFSDAINELSREVEGLRVMLEAAIDFPDEDVEILQDAQVNARIAALQTAVAHAVQTSRQGALLAQGITIALVGEPNVGKSSLLNALSGEETAIVTDVAGTTRDLLKVDLVLEGLPVRLVDTAGLREARDVVEEIGVERAKAQAQVADIVLWVNDASALPDGRLIEPTGLVDTEALKQAISVVNKVDLVDVDAATLQTPARTPVYLVSAKTGVGLAALREGILQRAGFSPNQAPFTARARHVEALEGVARCLDEASAGLAAGAAVELVAESLRHAHDRLGEIVGTVTADDLLGKIFAEFCIGK